MISGELDKKEQPLMVVLEAHPARALTVRGARVEDNSMIYVAQQANGGI